MRVVLCALPFLLAAVPSTVAMPAAERAVGVEVVAHLYVVKPVFAVAPGKGDRDVVEREIENVVEQLQKGIRHNFPGLDVTLVAAKEGEKASTRCAEATVSCDILFIEEQEPAGTKDRIELALSATAVPTRARRARASDAHNAQMINPTCGWPGGDKYADWSRCRAMNYFAIAQQLGEHHVSVHTPRP